MNDCVKQVLNLESHELFTQLCAHANLVRMGPRRGLFNSIQPVEEGVVRVWRDWLGRVVNSRDLDERVESSEGGRRVHGDEDVLWVDLNRHVGLRLRVRKSELHRTLPVLWNANDDDVAVSYEIEYQGTFLKALADQLCEVDPLQSSSFAHRICF